MYLFLTCFLQEKSPPSSSTNSFKEETVQVQARYYGPERNSSLPEVNGASHTQSAVHAVSP
jgi:hypothetical protein